MVLSPARRREEAWRRQGSDLIVARQRIFILLAFPCLSLALPCLGLRPGVRPAPSSRPSRHAPKCVQMGLGLAQTEFGAAAPPAKGRAHVAGGVGLSLCSAVSPSLPRPLHQRSADAELAPFATCVKICSDGPGLDACQVWWRCAAGKGAHSCSWT